MLQPPMQRRITSTPPVPDQRERRKQPLTDRPNNTRAPRATCKGSRDRGKQQLHALTVVASRARAVGARNARAGEMSRFSTRAPEAGEPDARPGSTPFSERKARQQEKATPCRVFRLAAELRQLLCAIAADSTG